MRLIGRIEAAGGRRFLMCVGVLVAATGLRAADRLSDDAYMWIVLGVVNGYIAGNTTQKVRGTGPVAKDPPD
jgi:hypothetical protein